MDLGIRVLGLRNDLYEREKEKTHIEKFWYIWAEPEELECRATRWWVLEGVEVDHS